MEDIPTYLVGDFNISLVPDDDHTPCRAIDHEDTAYNRNRGVYLEAATHRGRWGDRNPPAHSELSRGVRRRIVSSLYDKIHVNLRAPRSAVTESSEAHQVHS